jgi:hypothetical protein
MDEDDKRKRARQPSDGRARIGRARLSPAQVLARISKRKAKLEADDAPPPPATVDKGQQT